MSEEKMPVQIASRLVLAQMKVKDVTKDSVNSFHKYKYASAEDVLYTARVALLEAGLSVLRVGWRYIPAETELGTDYVSATYMVVDVDGNSFTFPNAETPAEPEKGRPADKAVAGALTVNQSYFLLGLLEIVRSDENEVDKRNDTAYVPKRQQPRPAPQPKAAPASEVGGPETVVLRGRFEDIMDPAELKLFVEKRKAAIVQFESQGKDMRLAITKTADRVGADPADALAWYASA